MDELPLTPVPMSDLPGGGENNEPQRGPKTSPEVTMAPGLFESCGWVLLFLVLQIFWTLVIWILAAVSCGLAPQAALDLDLSQLPVNLRLLLVTTPALLCFGSLLPLAWWRMSWQGGLQLGQRPMALSTWLVAISLIAPLTIVADTLFRLTESGFLQIAQRLNLTELPASDVHETLRRLSDASIWLTILMIAVVPAVGEEFLFRGLIGRGLVRRYGIVVGVTVSSLMFAAVHLYPPHVIAILPVGVVLHLVYLATGNFAVPVVFHFLNNSLAAIQLRRDQQDGEQASWLVIGCCALYVLLGLYWLWQGNPYFRQNRELRSYPTTDRAITAVVSERESPPTTVSPVATISAILMLLLSAALFAK